MTQLPRGGGAVMQRRNEAPDSLDLFPTAPWATRGFVERLFAKDYFRTRRIWEPAAGLDHMSDVLDEYAGDVLRSDVFDYGRGHLIGSFVGVGPDVIQPPPNVDWIITNPPFNEAIDFVLHAIEIAQEGVAMLLRTGWVGTEGRYDRLFKFKRPHLIAQYAERVPMVKGRWDPDASTMTEYAWFIWYPPLPTPTLSGFEWIAPGCRNQFSRFDDIARFASRGLVEEPAVGLPLLDDTPYDWAQKVKSHLRGETE